MSGSRKETDVSRFKDPRGLSVLVDLVPIPQSDKRSTSHILVHGEKKKRKENVLKKKSQGNEKKKERKVNIS